MRKKIIFSSASLLAIFIAVSHIQSVSARATMGSFVGEKIDIVKERVVGVSQGQNPSVGSQTGSNATGKEEVLTMNQGESQQLQIKNVLAKREELKQQVQERKLEQRSDMAAKHAMQMEGRFGVYSERLGAMIPKFQSRLDSIVEDGLDGSIAQTKLDEAADALTLATDQAGIAIDEFANIDPASFEDQQVLSEAAQDAAALARSNYKLALDVLREALEVMKEI